jgi:hypothetical protein
MFLAKNQADTLSLGHIGWKYYNRVTKKAMEQEFSWSGLLISLSIAFFIVITSATILNFINNSIVNNRIMNLPKLPNNIYRLESNVNLHDNFHLATQNILIYQAA